MMELTIPLADQSFLTHHTNLLKQVLPALYQPPETLENALTQMAASVFHNIKMKLA
jgi:hypothetical protein